MGGITMEKEFIEIPLGAKDSELCGWEYNIPEGFVASIENGKIIVKKEESEDEKIRKAIINYFKCQSRDEPSRKDTHNKWIAWLEKQGKDKEINNFDVLPGLYKCVNRMFDGTPDGKLLFEVGNIYKCLSKHDRAEFEVSYGHSVYLEDPVVCKHFIPFEKQGEQKTAWSKEDEIGLGDALWAIKQARTIAKDENDMGNLWYAERWLKLLKERLKGE